MAVILDLGSGAPQANFEVPGVWVECPNCDNGIIPADDSAGDGYVLGDCDRCAVPLTEAEDFRLRSELEDYYRSGGRFS